MSSLPTNAHRLVSNESFDSRSPPSFLPATYWDASLQKNRTKVDESRSQLFIGNLPFRIRWQDLKDLFRKCGTVLRADVALTPENRSKGFGTVLFQSERDAIKAIEMFNGYNWQGRVLDVRHDQQDPTGAIALAMAASQNPAPLLPHTNAWPVHLTHHAPGLAGSPILHAMPPPPPHLLPPNAFLGDQHSISRPASSNSYRPRRGSSRSRGPPSEVVWNQNADHDGPHSPSVTDEARSESSHAQPSVHHTQPFMPLMPMPGYVPYHLPHPQMHGGLMGYYHMPPRPSSSASNYANRHLFVGNLPFHCQWQDLKDLFRAAGNIVRADIQLGPDGKSKGFGSVLYATEQDAQRAVDMFNGYDLSGRHLKVHFDKFTHNANSLQGSPALQAAPSPSGLSSAFPPLTSTSDGGEEETNQSLPAQESSLPNHIRNGDQISDVLKTPEAPGRNSSGLSAAQADPVTGGQSIGQSYTMHMMNTHGRQAPGPLHFSPPHLSTGPAALMSPQPGSSSSVPGGFNPLSPQAGRINMTPSMPGFSFHPFPQTPPLMPQFLSPGIGPFSPPISLNTRFNLAPGAPLHFHGVASPETPAFASMLSNGYFPNPDQFSYRQSSSASEDEPDPEKQIESDRQQAELAVDGAPESEKEIGFFSTHLSSATLINRRASTNSAVTSNQKDSLNTARSVSTGATNTTPNATQVDDLSTDLGKLVVDKDVGASAPAYRRASIPAAELPPLSVPKNRGRLEAVSNSNNAARRASFETAANGIEIGRSIWSDQA